MNKRLLFMFFAMTPATALAQSAAPLLVDAGWLSGHLNDRGLVLLHVGSKKEYDAEHIPGARYIEMDDLALPMRHDGKPEIMLELPAPADLRKKVESFGISDNSRIVVYTGTGGRFPAATRIIFTLDYLGLGDRTSALNGGLAAWTSAGKAVTAVVPPPGTGKLTARATKNVVADAELVKSLGEHPNYKLVDARAAVYYNGTEPTYKKSGHIPGAINIPFTQITDDKMKLDPNHIAELFRGAGIKPGDTVVAYCHIGMQATAVMFGARMLGNPVMLYDGAFEDWATNNRGPVEK